MSTTLRVFLARERLPTLTQWRRHCLDHQLPVQLTEFDPQSHSGYVPCPDERSGFDYFVEAYTTASIEVPESVMPWLSNCDLMITLRCSERPADVTAARYAAAGLMLSAQGVIFEQDSGELVGTQSAAAWARHERYSPLAVHRHRSDRRRSRVNPLTFLRLLIVLALAAMSWMLLMS